MYPYLKRTLDFTLAVVSLVALSPLLLAIAVLVRLTSQGPILYRGTRTGRHGKPFKMLKFRSMVVDAENLGGTTTAKNDRRVTPLGHYLRKYKLDETPQLINVLVGQMSFVGPRPEVAEYTDAYTEDEKRILTVRPGVTDFSSIEFSDLQEWVGADHPDEVFRTKVLPRKIALRLKYVEQRSPLVDLRILLGTAGLLLARPFRAMRG